MKGNSYAADNWMKLKEWMEAEEDRETDDIKHDFYYACGLLRNFTATTNDFIPRDEAIICFLPSFSLLSLPSKKDLKFRIERLRRKNFGNISDEHRLSLFFCILKNNFDIFIHELSGNSLLNLILCCKNTLFLAELVRNNKSPLVTPSPITILASYFWECSMALKGAVPVKNFAEKIESLQQNLEELKLQSHRNQSHIFLKLEKSNFKKKKKKHCRKNNRKYFKRQNKVHARFGSFKR